MTVPEISCRLVHWQQLIVFDFFSEMALEIIHQCTNEMLFQQILIRHPSHYISRSKMQKEAKINFDENFMARRTVMRKWCWWHSHVTKNILENPSPTSIHCDFLPEKQCKRQKSQSYQWTVQADVWNQTIQTLQLHSNLWIRFHVMLWYMTIYYD